MAITTYSELKAAIVNWSHRDDVIALVDDFIDLCEAEIWNDLRIRQMEGRSTATVSSRYLALPTDYVDIRRLRLISGSLSYDLDPRPPTSLDIDSSSGIPSSYSVTSQIEFNRTPNGSFTAELQYWKKLTALDGTNTTNAVLTSYPQLYLYGSLYHLFTWTEQDDKAANYKLLFDTLVQDVNTKHKQAGYGPNPAARVKRFVI